MTWSGGPAGRVDSPRSPGSNTRLQVTATSVRWCAPRLARGHSRCCCPTGGGAASWPWTTRLIWPASAAPRSWPTSTATATSRTILLRSRRWCGTCSTTGPALSAALSAVVAAVREAVEAPARPVIVVAFSAGAVAALDHGRRTREPAAIDLLGAAADRRARHAYRDRCAGVAGTGRARRGVPDAHSRAARGRSRRSRERPAGDAAFPDPPRLRQP